MLGYRGTEGSYPGVIMEISVGCKCGGEACSVPELAHLVGSYIRAHQIFDQSPQIAISLIIYVLTTGFAEVQENKFLGSKQPYSLPRIQRSAGCYLEGILVCSGRSLWTKVDEKANRSFGAE